VYIIFTYTVTGADSAKIMDDHYFWETSVKSGGKERCLFFDHENGGGLFLRNVGLLSKEYMA
jgi:hypothetical protein